MDVKATAISDSILQFGALVSLRQFFLKTLRVFNDNNDTGAGR